MRKVMAADDEGYVRDALRQLVPWQALGCELCQVVTNGRELIDEMEQSHPDIIITDIRMPQVDGLEVCKYVYDTARNPKLLSSVHILILLMPVLRCATVPASMY